MKAFVRPPLRPFTAGPFARLASCSGSGEPKADEPPCLNEVGTGREEPATDPVKGATAAVIASGEVASVNGQARATSLAG